MRASSQSLVRLLTITHQTKKPNNRRTKVWSNNFFYWFVLGLSFLIFGCGDSTIEDRDLGGNLAGLDDKDRFCYPATICVPWDYDRIQDAIDVSEDQDTVLIVEAGEYYENIEIIGKNHFTLTKRPDIGEVTIIAEFHGSPVINIIVGTNITIEDLTITGTTEVAPNPAWAIGGIHIHNGPEGVIIRNCHIHTNVYGITPLINVSNVLIENNLIENNSGAGIYYGTNQGTFSDQVIRGNIFQDNNANAIYFWGSSNGDGLKISNNQFFRHGETSDYTVPRSAIYLAGPNHHVWGNTFEDNYTAILAAGDVENSGIRDNIMKTRTSNDPNYGHEAITWEGDDSILCANYISGYSIALNLMSEAMGNQVKLNEFCFNGADVIDDSGQNTVIDNYFCQDTDLIPAMALPKGARH